VFYFDRTIIL